MLTESDFIVGLAREGYWFEDNEKWAVNLLEAFQGITKDQIFAILNGDAIITGWDTCDDKNCTQCKGKTRSHYVEKSDEKLKNKINKRKLWLDETYFKIGQHHVEKQLVYDLIERVQKLIHDQNQSYVDIVEEDVEAIKKSFFTRSSHRYPSPDYIPRTGSYEYDYILTINDFLNNLQTTMTKTYPNFSKRKFLEQYKVIQKELKEPSKLKLQRAEGCVLFLIPDPKYKYKEIGYNVSKEFLLAFIKERSRGEKAMKFTLSMDLDKEMVLKRYKNLMKNMAYAHERLMESVGLWHSETGHYANTTVEYFLNEAILWYVYQVTIHNDAEILKELPKEIKLKLPKNHGYGIMSINGKVKDRYHDLR